MDSCILIPKQLSLVLTLHPDPTNLLEMCVAVWSNCNLPTGTTLHPDEGEIKYEKLETFSRLKSDNIRHQFGCYDEILTVDNREVRHCNWIRFIKSSSKLEEVNVIGIKLKGEIVFQLIKDVQPNEEIVVYFQTLQVERLVEEEKVHQDVLDEERKTPELVSTTSTDYTSPILPITTSISRNGITSGSDDSGIFSDSPSTREPSPVTEYKTIPARRSRERTWFSCDVCKKKFDRPSLLKRHMRTHTGEKPHVCETCNKAFSTSSSLNTHRRIHSGEKPHICNVCGKKFTASSNLYYHRMTHNKDKPHKCTECSKSFPTPGDLKSHMYVHNGSWPFKCQICNRGFSKQTILKNHLVLHSGERPHQCLTCNKSFSLACNLKTHMKIHEEYSSPVCTRCNKMAATSDGLCLKCRGDVRLSSHNSHTDSYLSNSKTSHPPSSFTSSQLSSDVTSQSPSGFTSSRSPSDFSISKITECSFKRQRLESNNFYNDSHSPYPVPVYCSTPVNNQTSFSTMSSSPQSNHFLSAMLLSRNTRSLMTSGY